MKYKKKIITSKFNYYNSIEIFYSDKKNYSPLIVYISGSGWMGHIKLIYKLSSWWNNKILNKLVKENYVCINIPYRGKFFVLPNILYILISIVISFYFNKIFGILVILSFNEWRKCIHDNSCYLKMKRDVEEKILYILKNNERLSKEYNTNGQIIFLSYSSGSQLLLSALENLNDIEYSPLIKGIIIVSGVLNIPYKENIKNKLTNKLLEIIHDKDRDILFCPSRSFTKFKNTPFLIINNLYEFYNFPIIENMIKELFRVDYFSKKILLDKLYTINSNHWTILTNLNVFNTIKNFINK